MMYRQIISIHGVPRSGTSWLGQIFDKHLRVIYRFQPLFAYRFRGRLSPFSSPEEIRALLDELYKVADDDFIAGKWPMSKDDAVVSDVTFCKEQQPDVMVMKEVRYHYLIEKFIDSVPEMKIIGIVRNPCAVISSWQQNPKEFSKDWDIMEEWRYAPKKNQGRAEEYFGFEKWKELTMAFLSFERKYPDRFFLVQYEKLVLAPVETMKKIFSFVGLEWEMQVEDFIRASQSHHVDDPYAVYKSPTVKDRWRQELNPRISERIINDLKGTVLEQFLV